MNKQVLLLLLAGLALIVGGVAMLSTAAALIVGGVLVVLAGVASLDVRERDRGTS